MTDFVHGPVGIVLEEIFFGENPEIADSWLSFLVGFCYNDLTYPSFSGISPMEHRLHYSFYRGDCHGKRCIDARKTFTPAQ